MKIKNLVLSTAAVAALAVLSLWSTGCGQKSDLTPPGAPAPEPTNAAAAVPMRNGAPIGGGGGAGMPAPAPSGLNSTPNPVQH